MNWWMVLSLIGGGCMGWGITGIVKPQNGKEFVDCVVLMIPAAIAFSVLMQFADKFL